MNPIHISKIKNEKEVDLDISGNDILARDLTYEQQLNFVSIIAHPMASEKLVKRIHKLIKKASGQKLHLKHGLRDVQKAIVKGEKGLVVFAGDVTPIEIMCHLPACCEERGLRYCYVPSRRGLGQAMGVNRGCLTVLIKEHASYQEQYDKVFEGMKLLHVL